MIKKIYTGYVFGQLAPAALRDCQFFIQESQQRIKICSVKVDYLLRVFPLGSGILPPEQNDVIRLDLVIFPPAAGFLPANIFVDQPGAPLDATGTEIHIYKRGQTVFNNLFAENVVDFRLQIQNEDALVTYFYNYSITVEAEIEGIRK